MITSPYHAHSHAHSLSFVAFPLSLTFCLQSAFMLPLSLLLAFPSTSLSSPLHYLLTPSFLFPPKPLLSLLSPFASPRLHPTFVPFPSLSLLSTTYPTLLPLLRPPPSPQNLYRPQVTRRPTALPPPPPSRGRVKAPCHSLLAGGGGG